MQKIYDSIEDLIGHTPLLKLNKLMKKFECQANIIGKCEFYNPIFSVKDRVALNMINKAPFSKINENTVFIEATSGNTGVGLAAFCAERGYKLVIVMPENMSEERKKIIQCLGAELVLTPAKESIGGSVKEAERLLAGLGDQGFMPQQFENPANPDIHYRTTAPEIYNELNGNVDIFVGGLGSAGTLQGIGRYLKDQNPDIKIIAVEPKNVSALHGDKPGIHQIQGIGDGFIPAVLDTSLIDEVVEVSDEDAIRTTRELAKIQGLLCGTSSGANIWACKQMAARYGSDKVIATVLADRMERYFSTGLLG